MSSSSDGHTITSVQARKALLTAFKAQRPIFLWGPPGIGKSEVVADICAELGGHMVDLRMAQMEPTDLRGIPFFNKDNGKMDWAPPIDLPDEELASQYPIVVLFLDEMNSAAPSVQAAGYQLILNRRIGKYKLPDNVVIVAAGNRDSDKGVTYRMPMPLANRFLHIEMKPDFESWQMWAVTNDVHKDVVSYLSFAKQDMYEFDAKSSSHAFPTPRSWVFVSDLLKSEDEIDSSTLHTLVAGSVGQGLASKFIAYRKISAKLPKPADILNGKVTELEIKELSAMYSLTISLCFEMRDIVNSKKLSSKQVDEMYDNFLSYIMTNFDKELVILAAKIACKTYKLDFDGTRLKHFDAFHKLVGKYIIDANQGNVSTRR
jgi:hypothetical protein